MPLSGVAVKDALRAFALGSGILDPRGLGFRV